jgi:hypothetical protein
LKSRRRTAARPYPPAFPPSRALSENLVRGVIIVTGTKTPLRLFPA